MRYLIALLSGLVIVLGIVGCQPGPMSKTGVEVNIGGDGVFPQELVGLWKASSWEIVFEADGSISSAVIPQARTRMVPKEPTIVPMRLGGKGVYEPGLWSVDYMPQSRELTVEIVVKRFKLELGDNVLKGKLRYLLSGQVSEDYKVWYCTTVSFPKYFAYTTSTPGPQELPVDPNHTVKEVLFEKVGD